MSGNLISFFFFLDNSASSAEHSQGLEKQGVHVARAAEAGPLVSGPAESAKKPCAGKP